MWRGKEKAKVKIKKSKEAPDYGCLFFIKVLRWQVREGDAKKIVEML